MATKKNKVREIRLGKIRDKRGNLSVVESGMSLPFEIKRTYWVYDVPGGEARQGHAYYKSDDGTASTTYHLDQCSKGIYIPAGTWRHLMNFATNSIALIITSTKYNPKDYIRDYGQFVEFKKSNP